MKFDIPLVLHIREAKLDGLMVMQEACVPKNYPIHRHCLGGHLSMARVWLEEFSECKIGVTNAVNNYFNTNIVKVIQGVEAEKIILVCSCNRPAQASKLLFYQSSCVCCSQGS